MSAARLFLLLAGLAVALSTDAFAEPHCSTPAGAFFKELATIAEGCSHPLCGAIVAARPSAAGSCVADDLKGALEKALSLHGAVLLGEAHDDAAHHLLQAAFIRQFARTDSAGKTGVVFEQLRDDQQTGLNQFAALKDDRSVATFKRLVDWDKAGWPKDIYDPLLDAVVNLQLRIFAGDVTRAAIMKTAKDGEASLASEMRTRLGLDAPLGTDADAASIKEIEASHCGMLPASAFAGMAYAQRYRDAHLADAVLRASEEGSAILIAGTAHARTDRGVPWYLHRRAPDNPVVSIMFVEVEAGQTEPAAYFPRSPGGGLAADYLVFTPAVDHGDPCAKMRRK